MVKALLAKEMDEPEIYDSVCRYNKNFITSGQGFSTSFPKVLHENAAPYSLSTTPDNWIYRTPENLQTCECGRISKMYLSA
jgi:hypothetical protein